MPSLSLPRRLMDRWFGPRIDADLVDTIAWSIDQVEPRLRQIGGYPRRYAPSIVHAWTYCRSLAAQVPGPVTVNRQAFAQDPLVHALFSSPEGIAQALVQSKAVREWHQNAGKEQGVFALMGVRRWEKDIFGVEDRGGVLRRDVAQKAVYFSDHTFSNLGLTLADARALLARQFMSSLLARVNDRLEEIRRNRQRLEREQDEMRARLRANRGSTEHQAALHQTMAALREAVAALDLRNYADHFDAVLLQPEPYLHLRPVSMSLDAMGIHQQQAGDGQAPPLALSEMACRDRRRWVVMLVHCRLDELPDYQERLATAEHWLAI